MDFDDQVRSRIRENSAAHATNESFVAWAAEFSRIRLPNLVGGRILTNSATELVIKTHKIQFKLVSTTCPIGENSDGRQPRRPGWAACARRRSCSICLGSRRPRNSASRQRLVPGSHPRPDEVGIADPMVPGLGQGTPCPIRPPLDFLPSPPLRPKRGRGEKIQRRHYHGADGGRGGLAPCEPLTSLAKPHERSRKIRLRSR